MNETVAPVAGAARQAAWRVMARKARQWLYFHSAYHRQMVMLGRLGVMEKQLNEIRTKLEKLHE